MYIIGYGSILILLVKLTTNSIDPTVKHLSLFTDSIDHQLKMFFFW